jgi:hypothetical protein
LGRHVRALGTDWRDYYFGLTAAGRDAHAAWRDALPESQR